MIFSKSPSSSNYQATFYLIYSPCWEFQKSSLHLFKPPKVRLYHLFHIRCYSIFFNIFILNPILPCVSTHQTRHLHLCNIKFFFFFLVGFLMPKFSLIQYHQSYSCAVRFSLKLEQYFLSQITHEALLHFIHLV